MKLLSNILSNYFGYFVLLGICLIKFLIPDLVKTTPFKNTALILLLAAILNLLLVILTGAMIREKYKRDDEEWLNQNNDKISVRFQNWLTKPGFISVIILFNAWHFYVILYMFNWLWVFIYIALIIVWGEVKRYLKRKEPSTPVEA